MERERGEGKSKPRQEPLKESSRDRLIESDINSPIEPCSESFSPVFCSSFSLSLTDRHQSPSSFSKSPSRSSGGVSIVSGIERIETQPADLSRLGCIVPFNIFSTLSLYLLPQSLLL